MDLDRYSYIAEWKKGMYDIIRLHYSKEQIGDERIEKYLNKQIENHLTDRKLLLVNNYNSKVSRVSTLQLIELIRNNALICAGGGCLFLQHNQKRNILIEFILDVMAKRKKAKAKRKQFPKGSDEWASADLEQLAAKLLINSLYGCLGYPGFIMFNIFLAEAITNQGKHIITSAINAIENFLGNATIFENTSEVYHVIQNIDREYNEKCKGFMSEEALNMFSQNIDLSKLQEMCVSRYIKHCKFVYDTEFINSLNRIFSRMPTGELLMIYYKNNFMEFSRLNFMKEKIKLLIKMNGPLKFCEDDSYGKGDTPEEIEASRKEILKVLYDIWDMYQLFVLYDYPIFDRLRKAMYTDKTKSLYTDTDSVFVSLNEFVEFITKEVFESTEESGMGEQDLNFTAANIALSIVNKMMDATMETLCRSINITPEYSKLLRLKNEFFFSRIMFAEKKKRYVSLAMLQEGQKLYDLDTGADGKAEIKGYDFIKAGTKPFVRNFYTNLCLEEILYPKEIDPTKIFKKFIAFKNLMEVEIRNGNMDFFRQANVKKPEYYKNPYSVQGVTGILLWNALMPDKKLEFPTDVNIVPICNLTWIIPTALKNASVNDSTEEALTGKPVRAVKMPCESNKKVQWFRDMYPEAYDKLFDGIYSSSNPLIQHMNLSSIAIPKNPDYEIPEYITALFDVESVINNAMSLGIPLLKSVGIHSFQASTNLELVSNMVSL